MKINIFKDSVKYIKESQSYIYFIVGTFFIFTLFGFINSENLTFLNEIIKNILDKTTNLKTTELINFIFLNNSKSALFSIFFGIFFGIFTLFNTIINGIVLGYVFSLSYQYSGFSELWRILPHGIFELPAIFISFGLGIKLGCLTPKFIYSYLKYFWKSNKIVVFIPIILALPSLISIPLLLINPDLFNSYSNLLPQIKELNLPQISIMFFFSFIIESIIYSIILALLLSIFNKKFKKISEIGFYKKNILLSATSFITIIIPLLILAAIIEGILIGLS